MELLNINNSNAFLSNDEDIYVNLFQVLFSTGKRNNFELSRYIPNKKEINDAFIQILIETLESGDITEDKDRLSIIKLIDAFHDKNEVLNQIVSNVDTTEAAERLGKKFMSAM